MLQLSLKTLQLTNSLPPYLQVEALEILDPQDPSPLAKVCLHFTLVLLAL